METYEFLARLAQSGVLVYFMILFAGVLVYALWPSRKARFDDAARIPLRED